MQRCAARHRVVWPGDKVSFFLEDWELARGPCSWVDAAREAPVSQQHSLSLTVDGLVTLKELGLW